MDHRLQQLRRRAASGDPEAEIHLAYAECRAGEHILRTDQIILSDDIFQADKDIGGCQCGMKVFSGVDLCKTGHHRLHRLYNTEPETPLQYWCVRMAFRSTEDALKWARRQTTDARASRNPVAPSRAFACRHHLTGLEACRQGLHFLGGPQENLTDHLIYRNCQATGCNYREKAECVGGYHDMAWNRQTDVAVCRKCTRSFEGMELCRLGHHFPDYLLNQRCIRENCRFHQKGTSLYKALAKSYNETGNLEAVCQMNGQIVARASGWDRKLAKYGVKKPRLDSEERARRNNSKWWKFVNPRSRLIIKFTHNFQENFGRLTHRSEYTAIRGELKTLWDGNWYPVPRK